ncbi:MAG TPA: 4-hydroxy-tetrahydrodipicolinate reductase [Acidimicrobiales bacterium]|nr:4-hydroxy-tetrahydrodipicolinate reductase [Acidimicrobiales bacterium]
MIRVAVFGAGGRMGQAVCRAVAEDPDLQLVAAVDPRLDGIDLRQVTGVDAAGLQIAGDAGALARAGAEVAVDFTVLEAARDNLRWCAEHGVHAVVGTTGFDQRELGELADLFATSDANCIVAANFAIGAVLMMRFAELAAPFMDSVEIVELHHDAKKDAPSGTSLRTAERIAAARAAAGLDDPADPTETTVLPGARGGTGPGGVHVHALRLPGLVAHQEVIFGALGQSLTLRHDSYERTSFMPGVVLAVKQVAQRPGLTVGLDTLLGF